MRTAILRITAIALVLPLATACAWLTWHNHTLDTHPTIAPGMPLRLWNCEPPIPSPTANPSFDFNGKPVYLVPLAQIPPLSY